MDQEDLVYDSSTLVTFARYLDDTAENRGWILNDKVTQEGMQVLEAFSSQIGCRTLFARL